MNKTCKDCYWYQGNCTNSEAIENLENDLDQIIDFDDWEGWENYFWGCCDRFSISAPIAEGQLSLFS